MQKPKQEESSEHLTSSESSIEKLISHPIFKVGHFVMTTINFISNLSKHF